MYYTLLALCHCMLIQNLAPGLVLCQQPGLLNGFPSSGTSQSFPISYRPKGKSWSEGRAWELLYCFGLREKHQQLGMPSQVDFSPITKIQTTKSSSKTQNKGNITRTRILAISKPQMNHQLNSKTHPLFHDIKAIT